MRGRTFSREFKLDVVQQIASGAKRPAQVCREHQLAETVLLRWRREYEERGEAAFTPREVAAGSPSAEQRVAELERFCGQLALENAALKKALQHLQAHQAAATKSGAR
jgi:putative transposase